MKKMLKTVAVKTVKPVVGDAAWQRLRAIARAATQPPPVRAVPAKPTSAPRTPKPPKTLTELGKEFRTDKAGIHRYTQHYERHLKHLRSTEFTLFEIGIGGYRRDRAGGASLRMWKAFFPKAQIVGLDIEDKSFVDEPRIRSYKGSQTDEEILRRIVADAGSDVQVIIDDGSHRPAHIRATFRILFPLLADGGIYAIEDIQTSYWPEVGGSENRHDPQTTMALVKDLVDGLNYEEYVDEEYDPSYTDLNVRAVHAYHNLVFIEKGRNAEGTNRRSILKKRYQRPLEPKIG